jgi:hypothetical protein
VAKVSQTVGLLALEKILTCPGEGRRWPGQVAKSKSSASKASEEAWKGGGGKRRVEIWRCGRRPIRAGACNRRHPSPWHAVFASGRHWGRRRRSGHPLRGHACPPESRCTGGFLQGRQGALTRVSRRPVSVGLSRPPRRGAHDSSCREVGGYMGEGHSKAVPEKRIGATHPA